MPALSEFALIERFFRRPAANAVLGIGDDAALVAPSTGCELAISVDMLVSGRHFFADANPHAIGHKTLAVNLSDMAAIGATPRWALLAGALPAIDTAWLSEFARGLFALADVHGVELIGGDTTRGPLTLCVTIVGEVPTGQALLRAGAGAGNSIWVSGPLGDAALALAHLQGRVSLRTDELAACERALLLPTPRVALGERLRGLATAAIDISDGLTGDLGHVLRASKLGATIELAAIPRGVAMKRLLSGAERDMALRCLLAGGDDYELCFTVPEGRDAVVVELARELGLPLARIGTTNGGSGIVVRDETGDNLAALPRAFDHFAP
jgi:thiamine-monophosphate kinase